MGLKNISLFLVLITVKLLIFNTFWKKNVVKIASSYNMPCVSGICTSLIWLKWFVLGSRKLQIKTNLPKNVAHIKSGQK